MPMDNGVNKNTSPIAFPYLPPPSSHNSLPPEMRHIKQGTLLTYVP